MCIDEIISAGFSFHAENNPVIAGVGFREEGFLFFNHVLHGTAAHLILRQVSVLTGTGTKTMQGFNEWVFWFLFISLW